MKSARSKAVSVIVVMMSIVMSMHVDAEIQSLTVVERLAISDGPRACCMTNRDLKTENPRNKNRELCSER